MIRNSLCIFCKHYNKESVTCTAYPEGIRLDFISGENYHLQPTGDDQGIIFEPSSEEARQNALELFGDVLQII